MVEAGLAVLDVVEDAALEETCQVGDHRDPRRRRDIRVVVAAERLLPAVVDNFEAAL